MKEIDVHSDWSELGDDLKHILGRPNFWCGSIARIMRGMGYECPRKAEMEQAMVIHTMLKFYGEHGKEWRKKFVEFLQNTNN